MKRASLFTRSVNTCAPPLHFLEHGGHVVRFRLADIVPNGANSKTIVSFEGAGGHGKTRAAFDVFNDYDGLKFWMSASSWDSPDAFTLAHHVLSATSALFDEQLVTQTRFRGLIRSAGMSLDQALRMLGRALMDELQMPMCFCVDDIHLLQEDSRTQAVVRELISFLPQGSLLLFTNRVPLNWLSSLKDLANIKRVDETQLRFSVEDTRKTLLRHGVTSESEELENLVDRYQGHPLACCLAGLNQADGDRADIEIIELEGIAAGQALSSLAAAHQARHVLRKETATARQLLRASALLPRFTAADCDALLGRNDSAALLNQLRNSVLLVNVSGEWRHNHDVIRETLLEALGETVSPEELHEMRLRAGQICAQRGRTRDALLQFVEGGHRAAARDLIEQHLWEWLDEQNALALHQHLEILPPAWAEGDPLLLIAQATADQGLGKKGFEETLERAKTLAEAQGKTVYAHWAQMELAALLNLDGKWEAADAAMPILSEDEQNAMQARLRARYFHIQLTVNCSLGRYQPALEYADRAMRLLQEMGANKALVRVWRDKNWAYAGSGQLRTGVRSAQELIEFCAKNVHSEITDIRNLSQLASMLIEVGEHEEARDLLNSIQVKVDSAVPADQPISLREFVLLQWMTYYNMAGEFEEAERLLNELKQIEDEDEWRYQRSPEGLLSLASLGAKQSQNFRVTMDAVWPEFLRRREQRPVIGRIMYRIFRAASLLLDNPSATDMRTAYELLNAAREALQDSECRHELANVNFWLTWLFHLKKNFAERDEHLQATLNFMKAQNALYLRMLSPHPASELWAVAIAQNIHRDHAEKLAMHPYVRRFMQPFADLLAHKDIQTRECAARITWHQGGAGSQWDGLLMDCKEDARPMFEQWLACGWLAAPGLAAFRSHLTWKQTQVFLAWLSPGVDGSIKQASVLCGVSLDTARTHITAAKRELRETPGAPAILDTHGDFARWASGMGWVASGA